MIPHRSHATHLRHREPDDEHRQTDRQSRDNRSTLFGKFRSANKTNKVCEGYNVASLVRIGKYVLDCFQLRGGQFDTEYVKSCRIRTGRSVKGFCLPPSINRAERREVERIIVDALAGLSGDLVGKYYPLNKMTKEEESQLIAVSGSSSSRHCVVDEVVCLSGGRDGFESDREHYLA